MENYKVMTLISLTNTPSTTILPPDLPFSNLHNGIPFQDPKSKKSYLFIPSETLPPHELHYAIRSSDLIIFILGKNNTYDNIKNYLKFIPPFIFITENDNKSEMKKFVQKYFSSKENIVKKERLFDVLSNDRIYGKSSIVSDRACFVPYGWENVGGKIAFSGWMSNGFLSRKLILNGRDEVEIERIWVDKDEISVDSFDCNDVVNKFFESDEMDVDSENDNETEENCDFEENDDSEEKENCSNIKEDKQHISLIEKYKEYKGIKNMGTCNFPTNSYPDYYKSLTFYSNFKSYENKVKKLKSTFENKKVTIIVKGHFNLNKFVSFFSVFDYESTKTIYNVEFQSNTLIKENEILILDLGHKYIEIRPLVTNSSNLKVHKQKEELCSGVMSFIGPVAFNLKKILIFKNDLSNLLSLGFNGDFYDRTIVEEVNLKGYVKKKEGRGCTIKNMFFSKDEVKYFKNIGLKSKGSNGIIKKSIGTHGIFKAYFCKPLGNGDAVTMSLYRRIFPSDN